ncbi:MAG: [protein-PII] uridylyltransferase [Thalassobaculales bacterium]
MAIALPKLEEEKPPPPRRGVAAPRHVVDRRRLAQDLAQLAARRDLTERELRGGVIARLKQALADGRAELARRLASDSDGPAYAAGHAYLMDQLIRVIHDLADGTIYPVANPTPGDQVTLAAVGGYGRGELAPQSDIDLLFLVALRKAPRAEQIVEFVLYALWDLGLKVGHATRTVADCLRLARQDITIRTALLEARWLWGDQAPFREMEARFRAEVVEGTALEFVEAKLAEAAARHRRLGDSRYALEPNLKDGKGGLRDLHTLFWLSRYCYGAATTDAMIERGVLTAEEARKLRKAHGFLTTVRCHLHLVTGRAEDRLTFDVQTEIGRRLGYTDHAGASGVERFMKHYFVVAKDVGDLTRIFCAAIEAAHQRRPRFRLPANPFARRRMSGFVPDGDRLSVPDDQVFERDPVNLLRLFRVAQEHDLDIHPRALRLVTRSLRRIGPALRADAEANRLFLEMLTHPKGPERILRRLNESGVFGKFLPDFGRVVAQMQFDMYHHWTVDEHTIFALGILARIEAGELRDVAPVASEVVHKVISRRALYVAVLLHDIAKGRGGDHSILGEKVAYQVGPRLGLTAEETETTAWLVRWHLLMSNTAFKRDINDPKTIEDFCAVVRSPERLRLLLVLTVADIRAVGPNVWNGWKAALLRELYFRADEVLSGHAAGQGAAARLRKAQDALRAALPDWPAEDFEAHVARGYAPYWLTLDTALHLRHARLVREAERDGRPLSVETRVDPQRSVTEITIYASDHPGLFARIAGAMAATGASIVDARIFTMANGMALDTFWVQDAASGEAIDRPDRLARLTVAIQQSLAGRLKTPAELANRLPTGPSRTRVFQVQPRVLIDNKASATHTVIEVNARDRLGLLADITAALAQLNLQVATAKISTYGESAYDVFYVKDVFGLKVDSPPRLEDIRNRLLAALEPARPAARKPA